MDRLKMAEMMVALYQIYAPFTGSVDVSIAHDRTLVLWAEVDGILTASEAIQLMKYAGEGLYAATS